MTTNPDPIETCPDCGKHMRKAAFFDLQEVYFFRECPDPMHEPREMAAPAVAPYTSDRLRAAGFRIYS